MENVYLARPRKLCFACGSHNQCIDPCPYHQHILTIDYSQIFHHKQVVNKGAHVIVCGETYCYSYLSWGHGTVHSSALPDKLSIHGNTYYFLFIVKNTPFLYLLVQYLSFYHNVMLMSNYTFIISAIFNMTMKFQK